MHICFLNMPIEYYSPVSGGAVSTIIMETARQLIPRGHRVSVLTIEGNDESYRVGEVVRIEVQSRNDLNILQRRLSRLRGRINQWDWPYYEYYRASFCRALAKIDAPDAVILFNDLVSSKYIRSVLPNTGILVWLQNEQGTNQKDIRETIACTDQFLTCSAYIRDWTIKRYGAPASKFTVVHSGVDLETFRPREDYLVPGSGLRTLFIGRIDPNKGPDIAADAVATLQAEGLPICLTVAGGTWFYNRGEESEDPYFRSLKQKMEIAGANYVGHVTRDKVPELIRRHDVVFVLSRSNEPFGLVVLEAMASGCAVISSNRGGLPEACGKAGILVDPDDFEGVVTRLRTLVTDPVSLKEQKRQSTSRVATTSWAAATDKVESVLSSY